MVIMKERAYAYGTPIRALLVYLGIYTKNPVSSTFLFPDSNSLLLQDFKLTIYLCGLFEVDAVESAVEGFGTKQNRHTDDVGPSGSSSQEQPGAQPPRRQIDGVFTITRCGAASFHASSFGLNPC